ncbi:MAG: B12-binding domain-containing radical SAM protein [Oligoflexia bacterium]|nr:B12-binding domain-containing radical SAM protein [Oligoflexia bacterium]
MINITAIAPNLLLLKDDMFTTGIPYMPVGLAYIVGELMEKFKFNSKFKNTANINVIDAFAENPNQWWIDGEFIVRGLTPSEVSERVGKFNSNYVIIYASTLIAHNSIVNICRKLRSDFPHLTIAIIENTQAVTAYSLSDPDVQSDLYASGVNKIICGDPEEEIFKLINLAYQSAHTETNNLDHLAFAAFELFPLQNYWNLKYAHGPFQSKSYLPIITSRGCPYTCGFCVIPTTNHRRWRYKSAKRVVEEIKYYIKRFNVFEFHLEDVNPTVSDQRIQEIAQEIIKQKLKITWKICAGTKPETIRSEQTLALMAESGLNYISISPESGSPEVMKKINKPFDLDHSINLIKKTGQLKIYSQACFVLGFPGETNYDLQMTKQMLLKLTKAGLDEVALFIVTPVPGSKIFKEGSLKGFKNYSDLNFSPKWRSDYHELNLFRLKLYRSFLLWKFRYHPLKIILQPFRFIFRRFQTKMEMVPYRAIHTYLMSKNLIGKKINL